MADVIKFGPKLAAATPPAPDQVNSDLVEALENLLKEAKEGEIVGGAFIVVNKQNIPGTMLLDRPGGGSAHQIISGMTLLVHDAWLAIRHMEDDE